MTPHSPGRRLFMLLWLSYALFVVYVTTLPFDFDPSMGHAVERSSAMSSDPFPAPAGLLALFSDMVQNVVLFAPLGALTALVLQRGRHLSLTPDPQSPIPHPRSPSRWLFIPAMSALVGGCLSVAVETLQLFTVDRTASLNDVLTNIAGAWAGGIVVVLVSGAAKRSSAWPRAADVLLRAYPVLLWGGVTAVAAWHPFDTTIDAGSIADKIAALLANPWEPGLFRNQPVDAVRYALFAASFAAVWDRFRLPRTAVNAVLAATLLGVVLETSQIFVLSRMPRLVDVALAALGGAAGSVLYRRFQRSSLAVAAAATIVVAWVAAGLMMLPPRTQVASQHAIDNAPSYADVLSTSEWRVSHAVDLTLAFFPIGFAVGMVVRPPRLWLATAAIGGVLAVTLELGQSWVGRHHVSVTDAGVLMVGALAGAWAAVPMQAGGSPDTSTDSW